MHFALVFFGRCSPTSILLQFLLWDHAMDIWCFLYFLDGVVLQVFCSIVFYGFPMFRDHVMDIFCLLYFLDYVVLQVFWLFATIYASIALWDYVGH